MEALVAFGIVIMIALGAVRMGTLALQRTGLSREAATFQAQSAFMGVGFTTSESESLVNHPVRRPRLAFLFELFFGHSHFPHFVVRIHS